MSKITAEMNSLMVAAGSTNPSVAFPAQAKLVAALVGPLREQVMPGDVFSDLFTVDNLSPGAAVEYPLFWLTPGTEGEYKAHEAPSLEQVEEFHIEGDKMTVQTKEYRAAIDTSLRYLREANWNVMDSMKTNLADQFTAKFNENALKTLVYAAVSAGTGISDSAVTTNSYVSKKLIAKMQTAMIRRAGGNSASSRRAKLTRVYLSPEAGDSVRDWGLSNVGEISDAKRDQIYELDGINGFNVFGTDFYMLEELGVGYSLNNYYQFLGGTFPANKVEIVIGIDDRRDDVFYMPVRMAPELYEDPALHRKGRWGMYGMADVGFVCTDTRFAMIGTV